MEGLASSGNIQGVPTDALVALLKHHRVNEVFKWVADFCLFCVPVSIATDRDHAMATCYSTDIDSILAFTPLSIPWHPVAIKGQDFTSTVPYVGFLWDLDNWSV